VRSSPVTIAIDGPSGSGKSSVSRAVARELGLEYLDTGAMYRALTWWCLDRGFDLTDPETVASASTRLPLEIGTDPEHPRITVDGTDIVQGVREPHISAHVSKIATNLAVRADMRDRQRRIIAAARGHSGGIVVEGRDITTVVAPDAEHRVLLSASEEARLSRRAKELQDNAVRQSADDTRDQVLRRDRDDATVSAFFEPAEGVVGIDTSHLTFDQSVAAVLSLVRGAPPTQDHPEPITEGLS
jgi:CMP/dCMP kinase